ncbi:MAG: hypothetical protein AAFO97_15110 [Pseudomonadota bacterium]
MSKVFLPGTNYEVIQRGWLRKTKHIVCQETGFEVPALPKFMVMFADMLDVSKAQAKNDDERMFGYTLAMQVLGDLSFGRASELTEMAEANHEYAMEFGLAAYRRAP